MTEKATRSAATPDTYTAPPRKASRSAATAGTPATTLIAIMIDADTGRVVRVEARDASGTGRDVSSAEKATLVNRWGGRNLEDLLEQAFEAGITSVLGGDPEPDSVEESSEDAQLRRSLLAPLIERSGVKRLMESAVLERVISSTLIEQSTTK